MEVRDLIEGLSRADGHLKVRVEAPGYETEKWCHGCKGKRASGWYRRYWTWTGCGFTAGKW